jgi:hypothetical protein
MGNFNRFKKETKNRRQIIKKILPYDHIDVI